jgi:hypothetical protein
VFVTCSDINHRCDARSRRSGSHLTSSVQIAASYLVLAEVFPASRSPLRHPHVIGGGAESAGGRSLLGSRSLIWAGDEGSTGPERAGVRSPLSVERGGTGTGSPYAYFSYDRQVVRNFTRPQPARPWIKISCGTMVDRGMAHAVEATFSLAFPGPLNGRIEPWNFRSHQSLFRPCPNLKSTPPGSGRAAAKSCGRRCEDTAAVP